MPFSSPVAEGKSYTQLLLTAKELFIINVYQKRKSWFMLKLSPYVG